MRHTSSVQFLPITYMGAYQGIRVALWGRGGQRLYPAADEVYCVPFTPTGKLRALRSAWREATGTCLPRSFRLPA